MYAKTVQRKLRKIHTTDEEEDGECSPVAPQGFDTELYHVQMTEKDLHQIARSYLISCSQYSKLEKELE